MSPTISIWVRDNSQKHLWKSALVLIFRILRAEGALDMHVLLSSYDLPEEKYIFPIELDDPLVTLWPKKLLDLVVSILDSYQLDFGAIEVFRYGHNNQDACPTILITVEDENEEGKEATWQKACTDISNHCQSEGADLPVALREYVSGRKEHDETPTGGIVGRVYNPLVSMGTSIGVEPKGAGTLGGYLELKDRKTGAIKLVGLTTYQVVRGSDKDWPAGKSCPSSSVLAN